MRIVLVFLMLVMVSIAGVSVLASTSFGSGAEAVADIASTARTRAQPPLATPAGGAPPPTATAAPPSPVLQAPQSATAVTLATGEALTFAIAAGETTGSIAERLTQQGLAPNAALFRFWVQWRGAEGRLQAGEYQLRRGMGMDEIIDALLAARAKDVAITFVEGRRLEEFADTLGKADVGIDPQRFLELARRGNFTYDFLEGKPAQASLEGYLFPDTYRVIPGKTTAEEIIHQMLKRFGEAFPAPLREQARNNSGFSVHQAVILASIIEREAQVKEERPRIAAVYTNRLRVRECLCADATIQYGIGKAPEWWPVLRDQVRNIEPENLFNTYTHAGLPPGPIASPGASALQAAADPEKTDYMYYVRDDLKNDGSHLFARTLAEHERNAARMRRPS
ncbi:MAG: endolytic transglycosylase MltG [Chloroflexota bacterium]|nr:endolytic transglycosylase MltG [Chloroflexota bacterium]